MTEMFLNGQNIVPVFQEMLCEGMRQGVAGGMLSETRRDIRDFDFPQED